MLLRRIHGCPAASLQALEVEDYPLQASPLGLFEVAFTRLVAGGRLVLHPRPDGNGSDADLTQAVIHLRTLAARCGFAISVAATAASTKGQASGLQIAFERTPESRRWRLSELGSEGLEQFASLFERAFDQTMPQTLWNWKYAGGRGCGVVARRGDALVGHYGATRRRILLFGQKAVALQICDAMVDPSERAIMTKTGVMAQLTASFLEIHQGIARVPLCFGFPSRRAMGLGERLGLYADVGGMREVRWQALPDRPRLATRVRQFASDDAADARTTDQLWTAMAEDFGKQVLAVRDAAYLRERYVSHPTHRYELLLVTERARPVALGMLVLRQHERDLELLDLVGPLAVHGRLVDQARRLAGRWGKETLYAWVPEGYAVPLAGRSGRVTDIGVRIPTNAWVRQELGTAALRGRWWLMSGDTDFH